MKELTREYLSTLTLKQLQLIDIKSAEEESLVQEYVSKIKGNMAPQIAFNRLTVPDLKSPEEEAEWQAKIDAYEKEHNIVLIKNADVELAEATEPTEPTEPIEATEDELIKELEEVTAEIEEVKAEIVPVVIPETFKVETVQFVPESSEDSNKTEELETTKKPFCEFCSSKARFHKVGCPLK